MSPEGLVVSERSVTAIAIRHKMVVVRCKEWKWDDQRWDSIESILYHMMHYDSHVTVFQPRRLTRGQRIQLSEVSICKRESAKVADNG